MAEMDRMFAEPAYAPSAYAMNGGIVRGRQAPRKRLSDGPAVGPLPPELSASGHRSERVLSLVIALEALRATPDVLDGPTG
jgi:hypothetical protein